MEQCTPFPAHRPKRQPWCACTCVKCPAPPAWIWPWEALPLSRALRRGLNRCDLAFWTTAPHLHHWSAPFKIIWYIYGYLQPSWSGLKTCVGCGDTAIPVLAPKSDSGRVTHWIHLPDPSPNSTFSTKPSCKCSLSPAAELEQVGEGLLTAKMV